MNGEASSSASPSTATIVDLTLDERTVIRRNADIEHERAVAIFDLLEENHFCLVNQPDVGPFHLRLSLEENRLLFDIETAGREPIDRVTLPLASLRRIVKDYFLVCESYYAAIKHSTPSQIEAIDMGRRGLHNEGSEVLRERLADKVEIDLPTARRLFTLICVLHIRG
ncbi:UPF0262 protein [Aliidongia dinghuensis]|uniref:UPF0262 protein GCM10011611_61240 n=1 Tax=Aliidongia dinghuensis TaxID=1867774 RepID=A0A8J2Z0Y9_9PROT|nr:UPF0262 family protein [Aliidongia dinghuensis]GGF46581.1 UPF0262 protein [Aliidongia dinghuensis]